MYVIMNITRLSQDRCLIPTIPQTEINHLRASIASGILHTEDLWWTKDKSSAEDNNFVCGS